MPLRSHLKALFTRNLRCQHRDQRFLKLDAPEMLEAPLMLSGAGDDLSVFSDEFQNAATLSNWQQINGNRQVLDVPV